MGLRQILGIRKGGETKPKPAPSRPKGNTSVALDDAPRKPTIQPQPASSRLTFSMPVRISGKDQSGRSFSEQTRTVWVDQGRIRVVTFEQPAVGAELVLESAELGRSDLVKVVWKGGRASSEQPLEIDLELIEIFESEGVWGTEYASPALPAGGNNCPADTALLALPGAPANPEMDPADEVPAAPLPERVASSREEPDSGGNGFSPPTPAGRVESNLTATAVIEPVVQPVEEMPQTAPPVGNLDDPAGATGTFDNAADPPNGGPFPRAGLPTLDITAIQVEVTRFVKDGAIEVTPQPSGQVHGQTEEALHRLDRAVDQLAIQAEARLHQLRREAEVSLAALTERNQERAAESAAAAADNFEREAKELAQRMRGEVEKAIQNAGRQGVHTASEELRQLATEIENRVSKQLEGQAATAVKQLTERLEASSAAVRNLEQESKALLERVRAEIGQALHSAEQQGFSAASKVLRQLAQSLETRVSAQLERQADTAIKQLTERLETSAAAAARNLEQDSKAVLERVRAQVETALGGAERQNVESASKDLRQLAKELEDEVSRRLTNQAGAVLEELTERLQAAAATLSAETRKQIESIAPAWRDAAAAKAVEAEEEEEKHLESVSQQAEALIGSLQQAAEKAGAELRVAKSALEAQSEVYRKHLQQLGSAGTEALEREAGALTERLRQDFDKALAEFRQQGATQNLEELSRRTDDFKQELTRELAQRSREAAQALTEQIQTAAAGLIQEAEKQIRALSCQSLQLAKEQVEEEVHREVKTAVVAETEATRRQTELSLETLRRTVEEALAGISQEANRLGEDLSRRWSEQAEVKGREAAEGLASQLRSSTSTLLENARERLAQLERESVGSLAEKAFGALEQQVTQAVERQVEEARMRVEEVGRAIESARSQASGQVESERAELEKQASTATERLQAMVAAQVQALEERSRQTVAGARSQLDEVLAGLEQIRTELYEEQEKTHKALVEDASNQLRGQVEAQAEVFQKRLEELATTGIQALRQEASALGDRLREDLDKALANVKWQGTGGTAEDRGQFADEVRRRFAQEIEKASRETAQTLDEQIRTSRASLVKEAQKQLETLSRQSLQPAVEEAAAKVKGEAKAAVTEEVQKAREQLESGESAIRKLAEEVQSGIEQTKTASEAAARKHRQQIEMAAKAETERLKHDANVVMEVLLGQLRATYQGLEQQAMLAAAKKISEELGHRGEDLTRRWVVQLEAKGRDVAERLSSRLESASSGLVETGRQRLDEMGRESIGSLVEKALKGFEQQVAQTVDDRMASARSRTEEAVRTMESAASEGSEQAKRAGVELEKQATALTEQLQATAAQQAQMLERRSQEIGRDVCARMDNALAGFEHGGTALRGELETTARTLVQNASNQLRSLAEETAKNLAAQPQLSAESGVEDARRQLLELFKQQKQSLEQQLESRFEAHRAEVQRLEKELARQKSGGAEPRTEGPARDEAKGFEKQVKEVVQEQLDWLRSEFDAPGRGVVRFPTRLVVLLMLLAMTPAVICIYLYLRPVMRLQTDPPPDFFDSRPAWGAKRFGDGKQEDLWLQTDRMVARAYWDWAAKHLEKKYPFGTRLPENPPIDLQVEGLGFPGGLDAEFAKVHYWQKLQKAWTEPQAWEKVTLWDAFP